MKKLDLLKLEIADYFINQLVFKSVIYYLKYIFESNDDNTQWVY